MDVRLFKSTKIVCVTKKLTTCFFNCFFARSSRQYQLKAEVRSTMKQTHLNRQSKTSYASAVRQCVVWHRKAVRLVWRGQCAFDGPNCQFYGERGIEVHHVIPQSKSQRLKYEITNGILLCPYHHDLAEKDAEEFLKALRGKWSEMYRAYEENLKSVNQPQMPLWSSELQQSAGELKNICYKLEEQK